MDAFVIPYINEREDQQGAEIFPLNLVKTWRSPEDTSITQHVVSSNPPSRSQRCFNQFDRKTDCFDGRELPKPLIPVGGSFQIVMTQ